MTPKTKKCKQRISQIDEEMLQKIKELHQLMTKENLTQSAELLQDCLTVCEGRVANILPTNKLSDKAEVVKITERNRGISFNRNANATRHVGSIESDSVETIYHNVVMQKRVSSSSEDPGTSNDLTNNINDLLIAG